MGVDIAVCFTNESIEIEKVVGATAIHTSKATSIYVALGGPTAMSGNKPFFVLWANDTLDLTNLCQELSLTNSPICIAWKSEHGGVAGYVSFQHGEIDSHVDEIGDEYLYLPSRGMEETFGVHLPLEGHDALFFPELLITEDVLCYCLDRHTKLVTKMSSETVITLFEDRLDVEPIFPFDV